MRRAGARVAGAGEHAEGACRRGAPSTRRRRRARAGRRPARGLGDPPGAVGRVAEVGGDRRAEVDAVAERVLEHPLRVRGRRSRRRARRRCGAARFALSQSVTEPGAAEATAGSERRRRAARGRREAGRARPSQHQGNRHAAGSRVEAAGYGWWREDPAREPGHGPRRRRTRRLQPRARAAASAATTSPCPAPPGPLDAELPPRCGAWCCAERGRSPLGRRRMDRARGRVHPRLPPARRARAQREGDGDRRRRGPAGARAAAPAACSPPTTERREDDRARAARLLERAADEVVCVSEDLLPAFSGDVRVIHNGVAPPVPRAARSGHGRGVRRPARRGQEPGALPARGGAGRGARFVVVGDGELRPSLEALARELGVDVTFTGAVPDARAANRRAPT